MDIKYHNSESFCIFEKQIQQKLKLLKKLAYVSKGAQKYYSAIICPKEAYTNTNFYTIQDLTEILKIESVINILSDKTDIDISLNYYHQSTFSKLQECQNKRMQLNDYELFGIIKECKNVGINKDITIQDTIILLNQIISTILSKEETAKLYILSKSKSKRK